MSIASEIQRLQQAKSGIKSAIESKWVTVPSDLKLQGYTDCINCIQQWGQIWDIPFFIGVWSATWNKWSRWLRSLSTCQIWNYIFFAYTENWYCSSWDAITWNVWYYKKWNKDICKSNRRDVLSSSSSNDYWHQWDSWIKVCWSCVYFCVCWCSRYCWVKCWYTCFNMNNDTFWSWTTWTLWTWYWSEWWYSWTITNIRDYDYCLRIYKNS